jgi:uroporphyrinogen decarboxylase
MKPDAISFDSQQPLSLMRKRVSCALQGNLNPDLLFAPLEEVERETRTLLESMDRDPGFILNLGGGIKPKTPWEAVKFLVNTVKNYASI